MKKFRELFRRQRVAGKVPAPTLDVDHEHDVVEMPCDMGRKVLRRCVTPGCDLMETVAATAAQQETVAPLTQWVRDFQQQVMTEVEEELHRKGRR